MPLLGGDQPFSVFFPAFPDVSASRCKIGDPGRGEGFLCDFLWKGEIELIVTTVKKFYFVFVTSGNERMDRNGVSF